MPDQAKAPGSPPADAPKLGTAAPAAALPAAKADAPRQPFEPGGFDLGAFDLGPLKFGAASEPARPPEPPRPPAEPSFKAAPKLPERTPAAAPPPPAAALPPLPAASPPRPAARPRLALRGDAITALSGEDALIQRLFAPIASHEGAFGLTDDAAAIAAPPGHDLVLTTDMLVAGVHFFADDPADAVARKALRVNLSDLAAKAADPLGFLLAVALPEALPPDWLEGFARGLAEDARAFKIALLGGDTVRTPGPLTISVTALGTVPAGAMMRRAGARPGDWIVVTGTIGDAALGLLQRREPAHPALDRLAVRDKAHLAERYLLPQPRTRLAGVLRHHASAAMDVSDGLIGDLAKLCALSGVGARVETALLPLSPAAAAATGNDPALLERVMTGGDDYEILATVAGGELDAFIAAAGRAGVAVTAIGEITAEPGLPVVYGPEGAMTLNRMSFSHF